MIPQTITQARQTYCNPVSASGIKKDFQCICRKAYYLCMLHITKFFSAAKFPVIANDLHLAYFASAGSQWPAIYLTKTTHLPH